MKLVSDGILFPFETTTLDRQHGEYRAQYDDECRRVDQEELGVVHEEYGEERNSKKDADERHEDEGDLLYAEFLIEPIHPVV